MNPALSIGIPARNEARYITCRKFDLFGDWYLVRNPGLVRTLLQGKSRSAADGFYDDVER